MSFVEDLEKKLLYELNAHIAQLDKALVTFLPSLEQCESIGLKENYTLEELNAFEALTARFSRISDILTQKLLRTFFQLMGEEPGFFIDRANLAEKLGLVDQADALLAKGQLRNTIAHEYITTSINEVFIDVLKYSEILLKTIEKVKTAIINKGYKVNGAGS